MAAAVIQAPCSYLNSAGCHYLSPGISGSLLQRSPKNQLKLCGPFKGVAATEVGLFTSSFILFFLSLSFILFQEIEETLPRLGDLGGLASERAR